MVSMKSGDLLWSQGIFLMMESSLTGTHLSTKSASTAWGQRHETVSLHFEWVGGRHGFELFQLSC
jgi:hypothetical protein